MSQIPQGRLSAGSASVKLGPKDPRSRRNAQGGLTDNDTDRKSIELRNGQLRIKAVDSLRALPENATVEDVRVALNALLAKLQGR